MGMNCVQIALDCLESIHCQFPESVSCELEDLKVRLRLLRVFYVCGKKWGKGVRWKSTLHSIEDTVCMHSLVIQCICLELKDDDDRVTLDAKGDHLYKKIHEFHDYVHQLFWQEMEELYLTLLDGPLQASSSSQDFEIGEVIDSLLHSWPDLLLSENYPAASRNAMWKLEENIRFLSNFLLFATYGGVELRRMEEFLIHIEVVVLNAVYVTFESWYYYSEMEDLYNQIISRIKPLESRVCRVYVEVLQASKLSLSPGTDRLLLSDFVDSLLFNLWELVSFHNCYVEIFNHRIQKLYTGLTFLRSILRKHKYKFEKLYEEMDENLIGALICEAGTIIFSLVGEETEEELVKKLEVQLSELETKFKTLMAAEETRKYAVMSASHFPQTNVLGFIDSVLEKIKSFSLYVDSVSFAKDTFQALHNDLMFSRSFLFDVMMQHNQNGKLLKLQSDCCFSPRDRFCS